MQKSSTADFKVQFESEDISFIFTLDENNTPLFSEVIYKDQMSAIAGAEHTAESPVTPITGTYKCTNCENQNSSFNGIPLNNEERTFNMLLTTADGQTNLSIQALVGILVDTDVFTNETCTTDDRFNICLIRSGETSSSEPLTWTGIHLSI
ncbi:hypothetical protein LZ575_11675 [Antarcticibacterium sp. 1MA-6-2]|uniref:hypothetical protein n=1 Tax=Antarcticibacterium sp. 1MA-6-2 TaxID=2908210 RepID=UPI001F24D50D|nr:hypothetical protein [Antarcticibacterium sp. 1MA-6-2]UJH89716.1 hypothetical protein LZ575_11675 [Antarcticibacterium sp. 1MA-6-2]